MAQPSETTINSRDTTTTTTQQPLTMQEEKNNTNDANKQIIKFIQERLYSSFIEATARRLFNVYVLDDKDYNLQAPDVRKFLFDILAAAQWPLVVPDETLDNVLRELGSNGKSMITWIEFKSYFVFLEDRPLNKLFQIATKICDKQQLENARLVSIKPIAETIENPSYDREIFKQKLKELIPESTLTFIYFLGGGSLLALVIGNFVEKLSNVQTYQIIVNEMSYSAEIRQFDTTQDMFPPLARAGGFKSKMARKIADTYIMVKQWDEKNLKLASTSKRLAHQASQKWREIDEQYKVQEKASTFTKNTLESVRDFDLQHQISKRLTDTAKDVDTKYNVSNKTQSIVDNLQANAAVQKVIQFSKDSVNTVDDIQKETKQLVQGKEVESHIMHSSQNETEVMRSSQNEAEGLQNTTTNNQNIHGDINTAGNNQQV